jgi:hypothetical protein
MHSVAGAISVVSGILVGTVAACGEAYASGNLPHWTWNALAVGVPEGELEGLAPGDSVAVGLAVALGVREAVGLTVALGLWDCVVEAVGERVSLPVAVAVLLELGVPLPVAELLGVRGAV